MNVHVLHDGQSPFTLESRDVILREFLESVRRDGRIGDKMLRLAVIERSGGRFVGWCCTGIKNELPSPNRERVYALSADCRGRGYMTQAVTALSDWLFEHTDTTVINGLARPANIASNRVLQKCGFAERDAIELEDGLYRHYRQSRLNARPNPLSLFE